MTARHPLTHRVPGVTQQPLRPGGSMTYEFALAHPGTYWFTSTSAPSSTVTCTRRSSAAGHWLTTAPTSTRRRPT